MQTWYPALQHVMHTSQGRRTWNIPPSYDFAPRVSSESAQLFAPMTRHCPLHTVTRSGPNQLCLLTIGSLAASIKACAWSQLWATAAEPSHELTGRGDSSAPLSRPGRMDWKCPGQSSVQGRHADEHGATVQRPGSLPDELEGVAAVRTSNSSPIARSPSYSYSCIDCAKQARHLCSIKLRVGQLLWEAVNRTWSIAGNGDIQSLLSSCHHNVSVTLAERLRGHPAERLRGHAWTAAFA